MTLQSGEEEGEKRHLSKAVEQDESYTKSLLMERIALAHRSFDTSEPNEIFVGPTTYDRCLHCFKNLLEKKEKAITHRLKDNR